MKTIMAATLLVLAVVTAPAAFAETMPVKGSVDMVMGDKVHINHAGIEEARKVVPLGSTITVFRHVGKTAAEKEIGSVKALSFVSDHYIEAQILKGDIKKGDYIKNFEPPSGK